MISTKTHAERKELYNKSARKFNRLTDKERRDIYNTVKLRFPYFEQHLAINNIREEDVFYVTDKFMESYLFGLLVDVMDSCKPKLMEEKESKVVGEDGLLDWIASDPDGEKVNDNMWWNL